MKRPELFPKTFDVCLYKLTEECGEVLQEVGKLQRHGIIAIDPLDVTIKYDNGKALMDELDDLEFTIKKLREYYLIVDKTPQKGDKWI